MSENKSRKLLLSNYIEMDTVSSIIESIIEINEEDNKQEKKLKDFERKPIHLYINSFGGSVYDGNALIDIIESSTTPVHTFCIGSSMSMGFAIFMAGEERFIGRTSTLMYHEVSSFVRDKLEGFKLEIEEMERLQRIYDDRILEKSVVSEDWLEDFKIRKAEWYISPEEAIDLKLATGYIEML